MKETERGERGRGKSWGRGMTECGEKEIGIESKNGSR